MKKVQKMIALTSLRRFDKEGKPVWLKPGAEFDADAQEARDRLQAGSARLVDKKPAAAKTP